MENNGLRKKTTRCLAMILTLIMVLGMATPFASATVVSYTVEHWLQDTDGDGYTRKDSDTEHPSGNAGDIVAAHAKEYEGFSVKTLPAAVLNENNPNVLKVYYERNQYAVYFNMDGGKYEDNSYNDGYKFESYSALYGDSIKLPEIDPIRAGYDFDYWIIELWDDDGTQTTLPDFPTNMPTGDLHLKANWTPTTTNYTILYWLEDPDNAGTYEYWKSNIVLNATTESEITQEILETNAETNRLSYYISYLSRYCNDFTYYNEYKTLAELNLKGNVVEGDGSTIVNVYYDWNEYTLIFDDKGYGITMNNHTYYKDSGDPYKITRKHFESIDAADWPVSTASAPSGQSFYN